MNEKQNKRSTKYVMIDPISSGAEDEIDLIELSLNLFKAWKTIFGTTIICLLLAIVYALNETEIFKAETLLAAAQEEKMSTSSAINQFGGLAAMAGISIPSDSNVEQVLATLQSRKFLNYFINKKNYFKYSLKILGMSKQKHGLSDLKSLSLLSKKL